jgi:predicted transcriptional regulator
MADDNSVPRVDPSLVAEIVRSYAAKNGIAIDQIGEVIATVYQTLSGLGTNTPAPAPVAERLTPAVPIRRSVQPDHVVCLEMRVSRQDTAPASPRRSWAGTSGVSHPLEVAG